MGLFLSIWGAIALICTIWIIFDILTNQKKMTTGMKVLWIVCGLFFGIVTAIVYFIIVKKNKF